MWLQAPGTTPSQKDGALHMIGTMADILLKKPMYKEQMEKFLVEIVFPEFASPHGHLRCALILSVILASISQLLAGMWVELWYSDPL